MFRSPGRWHPQNGGHPGTGLSWTEEDSGAREAISPRGQQSNDRIQEQQRQRFRNVGALSGSDKPGDAFWRQGLIQRCSTMRTPRKAGRRLLLRSPEAVELAPAAAREAATGSTGGRAVSTVDGR